MSSHSMDLILQSLGEAKDEKKGKAKKKGKVDNLELYKKGVAVLLKRRLIMARKTWMTKSKLKRLKRMSWRMYANKEAIVKKELSLVCPIFYVIIMSLYKVIIMSLF